jgi:uncharacterized membrane protein
LQHQYIKNFLLPIWFDVQPPGLHSRRPGPVPVMRLSDAGKMKLIIASKIIGVLMVWTGFFHFFFLPLHPLHSSADVNWIQIFYISSTESNFLIRWCIEFGNIWSFFLNILIDCLESFFQQILPFSVFLTNRLTNQLYLIFSNFRGTKASKLCDQI